MQCGTLLRELGDAVTGDWEKADGVLLFFGFCESERGRGSPIRPGAGGRFGGMIGLLIPLYLIPACRLSLVLPRWFAVASTFIRAPSQILSTRGAACARGGWIVILSGPGGLHGAMLKLVLPIMTSQYQGIGGVVKKKMYRTVFFFELGYLIQRRSFIGVDLRLIVSVCLKCRPGLS